MPTGTFVRIPPVHLVFLLVTVCGNSKRSSIVFYVSVHYRPSLLLLANRNARYSRIVGGATVFNTFALAILTKGDKRRRRIVLHGAGA